MIGVILCGGYSRRMGRDKAFLQHQGKYFLEIALDNMEGLVDDCYLSCRQDQVDLFQGFGKCIPDLEGGEGPLGGIVSLFGVIKTSMLILPCDMPALNHNVLSRITAVHHPVWHASVFSYRSEILPFPVVLSPHTGTFLLKLFKEGERSLMSALGSLDLFRLPIDSVEGFHNVNSPEHLRSLPRI